LTNCATVSAVTRWTGWPTQAGGVLVIDETGFAKKGETSVGVARQFSGSLGGAFPCQVGVFAAWATSRGAALIDREIYLPRAWADDRERRVAAQVPETACFATKPRLAETMIDRILPQLPTGTWLTADETSDAEDLSSGLGELSV
jgi:SRSO17 transposase